MFRWENESRQAQLAHDDFQSQILENKAKFDAKRDEELYLSSQYNPSGTPLSDLVLAMIQANTIKATYYKHQVSMNISIYDAVNNACILLGLSSEDFSPYLHDKEMIVEIYLQ